MDSKVKPVDWQHPFVDVFRKFCVFESSIDAIKGNAKQIQDNSIGRKVFKLLGQVPASNYIKIPDPKYNIKHLGLTGRYLYVEMMTVLDKVFSMHFDFTINEREPLVKFTLSNMFDGYKFSSNQTLQIPYPREAKVKWSIVVIDIEHHLEAFNIIPKSVAQSYKKVHSLKSIQICSNVVVRGVFTSDELYDVANLPREMSFKMLRDKKWEEEFNYISYPADIFALKKVSPIEKQKEKQRSLSPKGILKEGKESQAIRPQTALPSRIPLNKGSPLRELPPQQMILSEHPMKKEVLRNTVTFGNKFEEEKSLLLKSNADSIRNVELISKKFNKSKNSQPLYPNPIVKLNRCYGFSGNYCPDLKWSNNYEYPSEIVYSSGKLIISSDTHSGKNRIFFGHNEPICCLDVSRDGSLIATGQEGGQSNKRNMIKLWDFAEGTCVCGFDAPYSRLKLIGFSHNARRLFTVGNDNLGRERIIIWDIDGVKERKKPEILAKQLSDFNILCCKFSPVDQERLVSCGRENIRFWRIKKDHLKSGAAHLNHHSRNTVFTVLDFEFNHEDPTSALQSDKLKRVFVGSKDGLLFHIDYLTQQPLGVYKIHESSVCSISVSAGFCVTGSEDQYLRVWPLDFTEFFLEAKHEGIVISLNVSQDALKVVCGTSTGGLGVLDLGNQSYKTILRSHTDEITRMVIQEFSNTLITLSSDLSIRIWDLEKFEQIYEFSYPREDACLCITPYPTGNYFVGGFSSGIFRVFDIENTVAIEEGKYHEAAIKALAYSPDGRRLVAGDASSFYCVYDVTRNYQPIKTLDQEVGSEFQSISYTRKGDVFATIGDSGNHINIYNSESFLLNLKIFCTNSFVKKLEFASNNQELFVITKECRVRVYGLEKTEDGFWQAYFLRESGAIHSERINEIALSKNQKFIASAGGDSMLKIWDYNFSSQPQHFMAHVKEVTSVLFSLDNKKVITAGAFEGFYVWEFLGDVSWDEEAMPLSFEGMLPVSKKKFESCYAKQKLKSAAAYGCISNESKLPELEELNEELEIRAEAENAEGDEFAEEKPREHIIEVYSQDNLVHPLEAEEKLQEELQRIQKENAEQQNRILEKKGLSQAFSEVRKVSEQRLPAPKNRVEREFRRIEEKSYREPISKYTPDASRIKHKLPFKHYFLDEKASLIEEKIEKLKDNKDSLKLQHISGINNEVSNNIAWNYVLGWFAYLVDNMVVIEELTAKKKQRVVSLPSQLSCISISIDGKKLVVGSACPNDEEVAHIYVLDCNSFLISKKLSFHTRGVQKMIFSRDGNFLISIGNFKESTVAVWNFQAGKLITSSYTLDKINDIKLSKNTYAPDRILEFTTVGRDQVQFWALNTNEKLEYYDVFIEKIEGEIQEITAHDYIQDARREFVLAGTARGEIHLIEYNVFQTVSRHKLTDSEIVHIETIQEKQIAVVVALDGFIYFSRNLLQREWDFSRLRVPNIPISISLDPTLGEGLTTTLDGGVYYVNLKEGQVQLLVGTPNPYKAYKLCNLNEHFALSVHEDDKSKLINIATGEELFCYKFKAVCTAVSYDRKNNKAICFFENNNEVKYLDLGKIGQIESFRYDDDIGSGRKAEDYVVSCNELLIENSRYFVLVMRSGDLFMMDIDSYNDSFLIFKAAELPKGPVFETVFLHERFMAVASEDSTVQVFSIEKGANDARAFVLGVVDDFCYFEDPYGNDVDKRLDYREMTQSLYKNEFAKTHMASRKENDGNYFLINESLQFLYIRNYCRKTIVKRIPLSSFPVSIGCMSFEGLTDAKILIGLEDGDTFVYNGASYELEQVFHPFLRGPLNSIVTVNKKRKLALAYPDGICFFDFKY